jgi:hypothetical protein
MKKALPIIILLVGIVVVVAVYLVFKVQGGKTKEKNEEQPSEDAVPVIALENRPVVSLTPSSDGHWLKLEIKKILIDAATLDYELTYKVPDGRTQGVPGTVKLTTKDDISKDLLLGSESSGKFRYDEGVENGELIFRFRDTNGKLLAKFSTDFKLAAFAKEISSADGLFNITLEKTTPKSYLVIMNTIGYPGEEKLENSTRLYGVFSSNKDNYIKSVEITDSLGITFWDGMSWKSKYENIGNGVFAAT